MCIVFIDSSTLMIRGVALERVRLFFCDLGRASWSDTIEILLTYHVSHDRITSLAEGLRLNG
jgi:hypothetical protein